MNRREFTGALISSIVALFALRLEEFMVWWRSFFGEMTAKTREVIAAVGDTYEFRLNSYPHFVCKEPGYNIRISI